MLRILTIDGGGIRGVLPSKLLTRLEELIQEKVGGSPIKIGDYFDMIAGTSTGGILSAFLLCPNEKGKAKYSAKEAVDSYLEHGAQIFEKSISVSSDSSNEITSQKYSAHNLEYFLKNKLGENLWLSDLIKPCLITSYDVKNNKIMLFNYSNSKNPCSDFKVWEIARATSAAPTYFETAKITSRVGESFSCIDGGVFAYNPSLCAYVEAKQYLNKLKGEFISAKDMFMVSLGTLSSNKMHAYENIEGSNNQQWFKSLTDIMMSGSAETVDYHLKYIFESEDSSNQYIRLEPNTGSSNLEMDAVTIENINSLKLAGERSTAVFEDKLIYIADKLIEYKKQS
jgi:patatin-like phospholipase/acyl hydrolase